MRSNAIPIEFSVGEVLSMYLGNGHFSVTRFKRIFRNRARIVLSERYRELHGTDLDVGRITVRDVDGVTPKDFLLDVSCSSVGKIRWRQTFRYVFAEPGRSLRGFLIPGRKHHVE